MKNKVMVIDHFKSDDFAVINDVLRHDVAHFVHIHEAHAAIERASDQAFDLMFYCYGLDEDLGVNLLPELVKTNPFHTPIVLVSDQENIGLDEVHNLGASHGLGRPLLKDDIENLWKEAKFLGEKRHSHRITVEDSSDMDLVGEINFFGKKISTQLQNIGRGGFFYEVDSGELVPPVGAVLDFELKTSFLMEHAISGQGIVRWTNQKGAGIEFLFLDDDARELVHSFLDLFRVNTYVPSEK